MLTQPPTFTPAPTYTATLIPTLTRWYYPAGGGGGTGGGGGGGGTGSNKPCLAAKLVRDITIPDGQWLPTNYDFVKVWQIQNTGSCAWDHSVKFFPSGGSDLDGDTINLPKNVQPGKSIDLAVHLETPSYSGSVTDEWLFKAGGQTFGDGGKHPFIVSVNVSDSPPNEVYHFASDACDGSWQSNARFSQNTGKIVLGGTTALSCSGRWDNPIGFVYKDGDPNTEAGPQNKTSIWTVPPRADGGIIEGSFPAQIILPGPYFFKAQVGCRHDANNCSVTFQISYEVIVPPNNEISENSANFNQTYDTSLDSISIDLSGLIGQYVRFEFRVRANNNSDENYSVWIDPRITR